jgi:hypothetical protein
MTIQRWPHPDPRRPFDAALEPASAVQYYTSAQSAPRPPTRPRQSPYDRAPVVSDSAAVNPVDRQRAQLIPSEVAHWQTKCEPTTHPLFVLVWRHFWSSCQTATNTVWSMSSPAVVLESATHRTLHAQGFSRSSTQASLVLTDLFSRYLTLLSSTCAKYTAHAGRTRLTARDALAALDELGVGMDELTEYCASEGREMRRFALHTVRRVEDLNELKGQLARAPCTPPFLPARP